MTDHIRASSTSNSSKTCGCWLTCFALKGLEVPAPGRELQQLARGPVPLRSLVNLLATV